MQDLIWKLRIAWEVDPERFAVYGLTGAGVLLMGLVGVGKLV